MGRPKQLLPIDGVPMLVRMINTARAAGCRPIVVVLGRDAAACRALVAGDDVLLPTNAEWETGIGSSLRIGANALPDDIDAAFVLLCDQPGVTTATLTRLSAAADEKQAAVAVASYAETLGPPVRINADYLSLLRQWPDAHGAKRLWMERPSDVVRVDCPEAAFDVDTPDDYAAITAVPPTDEAQ